MMVSACRRGRPVGLRTRPYLDCSDLQGALPSPQLCPHLCTPAGRWQSAARQQHTHDEPQHPAAEDRWASDKGVSGGSEGDSENPVQGVLTLPEPCDMINVASGARAPMQ